jgi:lysozyme
MRLAWKLALAAVASGAGAALAYVLVDRGFVYLNHPDRARYPVRGVDVSHHQGTIDWPRLAGAGVRFAYIKASEGASFRDVAFDENWAGAQRAGLAVGAYHYFTFCAPGVAQAANFAGALSTASGPRRLPPAVDLEYGGNCGARPSVAAFAAELAAFLADVESAAGGPLVLYVTEDLYRDYLEGRFVDHPLWVRSVFTRPRFLGGRAWSFWQYGNRGRLPGVRPFVDLDAYNGTERGFEDLLRRGLAGRGAS